MHHYSPPTFYMLELIPMSPDLMKKLAKPMLFSAALIWGTSFVVMKNALDAVPAFYLVAFRFTLGTLILAAAVGRGWKNFDSGCLWRGALSGFILFLVYAAQTYGLHCTTPSKNAFLTAVYCVIVPFLAWAALGQRPDRYNVVAAALCIAGVGLVSLDEQLTIGAGDLLTLAGALMCAVNLISVVLLSRDRDIALFTVFQFFFTGLYCWIAGALVEEFPIGAFQNPAAIGAVVYLGVMCTAVAMLFQNMGMVWSDPAAAAIILSLESVTGVLFSVLFYGDPVNPRLLAGFTLIFVAVVCSETKFSFLRRKPGDTMIDS